MCTGSVRPSAVSLLDSASFSSITRRTTISVCLPSDFPIRRAWKLTQDPFCSRHIPAPGRVCPCGKDLFAVHVGCRLCAVHDTNVPPAQLPMGQHTACLYCPGMLRHSVCLLLLWRIDSQTFPFRIFRGRGEQGRAVRWRTLEGFLRHNHLIRDCIEISIKHFQADIRHISFCFFDFCVF